jgi:hypothetical protein
MFTLLNRSLDLPVPGLTFGEEGKTQALTKGIIIYMLRG